MNATFSRTSKDGSETYVYVRGRLVWKRWNWNAWVSGGPKRYSKLFQVAPSATEFLIEYDAEAYERMIGVACIMWAEALRDNFGRKQARERRIARRASRRATEKRSAGK